MSTGVHLPHARFFSQMGESRESIMEGLCLLATLHCTVFPQRPALAKRRATLISIELDLCPKLTHSSGLSFSEAQLWRGPRLQ